MTNSRQWHVGSGNLIETDLPELAQKLLPAASLQEFERVTNEKYLEAKIYEGKYILPIHIHFRNIFTMMMTICHWFLWDEEAEVGANYTSVKTLSQFLNLQFLSQWDNHIHTVNWGRVETMAVQAPPPSKSFPISCHRTLMGCKEFCACTKVWPWLGLPLAAFLYF